MHQHPASWNIASASVQGASHRLADVECQDVHRVEVTQHGSLIIVVADGAGSAKNARWGAEIAVANVFERVRLLLEASPPDSLDTLVDIVMSSVRYGHDAIVDTATRLGQPLRSFHATLTCVIASDVGVAVGKIGDGVVVDQSPMYGLQTLAMPDNGEYVNSTYFLTQLSDGYAGLYGVEYLPDSIAVMTDGLLEVAFDQPYGACVPWPNFFGPMFTWLASSNSEVDMDAELAGFLGSDAIRERSDDDLTLVLATRRPPIPSTEAATGDTRPTS